MTDCFCFQTLGIIKSLAKLVFTEGILSCLYYVVLMVVRLVFFLLTRWEARGRENVPREGAVVVVSNHLSIVDPVLLVFCLGRKTAFIAKEELFYNRLSDFLLRWLGAFPVRKGRLNRDALRRANEILSSGQPLGIFPEGMRSKRAQLKSAYAGSALIAVRSQVSVLPVGISGSEVVRGLGWVWRRPRILVNIGRPFYLPQINGKMEREELNELTHTIMGHIAELLPPQYRGVYSRKGEPDGAEN